MMKSTNILCEQHLQYYVAYRLLVNKAAEKTEAREKLF